MNERPNCECHNVTMTVRNDRPRNPWRCTVTHAEARDRYEYSDKGRDTREAYEASDHGRSVRSRYASSAAGFLASLRSNARRRRAPFDPHYVFVFPAPNPKPAEEAQK
jgi:hypothetical protein